MEIPFLKNFTRRVVEKTVKLPIISELINNTRFYLPSSKGDENYLKEYKNWVYACINARAEEIASIELYIENEKTGEKTEQSPLFDLLNDVNPTTTRYELFFATQAFLDLCGNAYWYLARDNDGKGKIREIYLISPDKMHIITDKANPIKVEGYVYANAKEKIPFATNEILHFKNFNATAKYPNPHKGMGVVEAALWAIETDNEARNWNYSFFKNSAKPDGILTTEQVMGDEQFKRLKTQWDQEFRGASKTGKMALLENGTKWQDISKTQKDMDFVAQRTFSRDEILSIFRTPKTVVAITDDVNRANAEASDYVFAKRTVRPLMERFVTTLNEYLLSEFETDKNKKIEFVNPIPEDRLATITEYTNGMNKWLSRNDIRRREGLEPTENGDVFYAPFGDSPVDTAPVVKKIEAKPVTVKDVKASPVDKAVDMFIAKLPKKKEMRRLSTALKNVYIELFVKRFDKNEKALMKDVSKYFKDQEEEVQDNLKEEVKGLQPKEYRFKGIDDILFNDKRAITTGISLITPYIRLFLKEGGEMADAQTGGDFNINHADSAKFIQERSKFFAETINITTREALLASIKEGIDAAEGFDQISQRITDVYKDAEAYRVERIARTEVSSALNEGAIQGYKQAGITKLEWVTVNGGEAEICQDNDGEIRDIGKAFPSGETQPPNHPNCKCSVVAVFED